MGIYIKGMTMPHDDNNLLCIISSDGKIQYKSHTEKKWHDGTAIPIPPHGRLIDADAVYKVIKEDEEWVASNFGDEEQTLLLGYQCAYGRSRRMIRHAPTIIEAEEEDEQ